MGFAHIMKHCGVCICTMFLWFFLLQYKTAKGFCVTTALFSSSLDLETIKSIFADATHDDELDEACSRYVFFMFMPSLVLYCCGTLEEMSSSYSLFISCPSSGIPRSYRTICMIVVLLSLFTFSQGKCHPGLINP
jgi:hypothetical protein